MSLKPDNWDIEADLVCVGSGLGRMTAKNVAYEFGKNRVVLEKFDKVRPKILSLYLNR